MTPEQISTSLREALVLSTPAPDRSSLLAPAARHILTMAESYCDDSEYFYQQNDTVNAIAASAYGHGWLDCGIRTGLIRTDATRRLRPVGVPLRLPAAGAERLNEKCGRYREMLDAALNSVRNTAPAGTTSCMIGDTARRVATFCRDRACEMNTPAPLALVCLSYGYGWLDCAVWIGILSAGDRRDLFPI
ncbi:MAG: DUF357 domain-containing protein [Methanoculleaceae archaeon]